MNYTENDIRYFLELFRVYGTKPYSSNTYISPNALIGVIKDPNEYDVSRMLMNCMAYYLHLDFSDDEIVRHFIYARDVADGTNRPIIGQDIAFQTMASLAGKIRDGSLEAHHVIAVLRLVLIAVKEKGFIFDFSSMFKPDRLGTMISLAIHTPSRLQYHPRAKEICEGIHRTCKANNKKLGHREGEKIVKELIKEISAIKTDSSDIVVGKLRLNDILKKILRLYRDVPSPDILMMYLNKMYPKGCNLSTTYAGMTTAVLLDNFLDNLEETKKVINKYDFYPCFVHIILSYFDALCSRVGLDVFDAIIEGRDLYYSDLEEGWGI